MNNRRSYLLFRDADSVVAALGPPLIGERYPTSMVVQGVEYRALEGEDTFIFWNELRDELDRTVGFEFLLPESPTFRHSRFLLESSNVFLGDANQEVRIVLNQRAITTIEPVQGFGSEVYVRGNDPRDCILYLIDWSENSIAFPLQPLAITAT